MSNATQHSMGFRHRFEPSTSGSRETLLLLHGTGGDESDLIDLGRQLAPNAALLSPRGNVSENGANRFFRRLREGVFDVEDLKHRTQELAEFVITAAKEYELDQQQIRAIGFSSGANIAGAMLLLRPEVIRYAALLRPMVPLRPPHAPNLDDHKVLIAAGRADPLVSPAQVAELAEMLEDYGADVTVTTANAGHHLSPADVESVSQWLKTTGS